MIADLKPYPAYKDSGVEWLGDMPEHWSLTPNRSMLRRKKVLVGNRHTNYALLSLTRAGVIIRDVSTGRGKFSADMGTSQEVRSGDFIFCLFDIPETPRTVGLSRHNGMITGAYSVFECDDRVLSRFLETFYIAMDDIKALSPLYSGLRNTIPPSRFLSIKTPVPPRDEQTAIVRFLDHFDRRIRRYIRAKQKLITLLEEQKQVIIHQAVTGQIDVRTGQPYPAYKDSGVEWLGRVPEHWEVRRIKTLCSMKSGAGITTMSIDPTGEYPVYGGNGLRGYTSNYTHDGNFALIGRQGALCGNVHIARGQFWASEHAVVVTIHSDHVLEWFGAILGVMNLNQYSIAAAQPGLAVERVLNLWVPVPPSEEQAVIATNIEQQTSYIDVAVNRDRCQISLLREYRTRLIADVVTGKLDVREEEARLPEVDPLAGEFDALTTEAAETGMMELGDATEKPEELAMENEVTI